MCGLVAALLQQPWLTHERLDGALSAISHRGPDGSATWFAPDRRTALGHVRLSIIGLDNGTQPLGHDRGELNAVVNGEFYGYKKIRRQLRELGYRFTTDSDSEIALHLYDEHGLDFVDHLRGEYGLVIADRRSGELIAVRDRFGIKPLFYSQLDGDVIFASEIKALLALGVPARWDATAVMAELSSVRSNSSMFENIHQVPPGCIAIAKNGAVRVERYWDTRYPTSAELAREPRSEAEIIAGFRSVLDDAVAERLTADVEVACYLSGGLDSSAVLGLAQAQLSRPIRAFTIAFEGSYDESPLAERTAAFTGSNYVPVPVSSRNLADALSDAIWHSEKPIFNANTVAKYLLSRAVRDAGIKVVFTGEGADEILAGYPFERRDLMLFGGDYETEQEREAAIAALIEANPLSRQIMFPPGEPASGTALIRAACGFCPTWIENISKMYGGLIAVMRADVHDAVDLEQPYRTLLSEIDVEGHIVGRDAVNTSLYLWQKSMLINFILTVLGDRMEMAHSVEGRVPFLDHHVAEYAASLPVPYKIRETTEKYVLREAARDVLTPELYARQKHPFIAPPIASSDESQRRDTGIDPMRERCEDTIRSKSFADQPFFDPEKATAWLDSLTDADSVTLDQATPIVLRMATLSLMQQRFAMGT